MKAVVCKACDGQATYDCPRCHGHGCDLCDSQEFPCQVCGGSCVFGLPTDIELARMNSVAKRFEKDKGPCWDGCGEDVTKRKEKVGDTYRLRQIDIRAAHHACPRRSDP